MSGSVLFGSPDTLSSFTQKTRELLAALEAIDERFANWTILGHADFEALSEDLAGLDQHISQNILKRGSNDLILTSGETMAGPQSLSRVGFSLDLRAETPAQRTEIRLHGISAGTEPRGGISVSMSVDPSSHSNWPTIARRLIVATSSIWRLSVVGIGPSAFEDAIRAKGDLYSGQWMTYYRLHELSDCLSDNVNASQPTEGTLIETVPHLPDAANPADVAAGKRVREALDHLGLVWHSTYAIHGWPPDEEEWRYEEFISGAPRGRKYRVRCIDFDGYDAQRNVLLYAKLFRRLRSQRKEWGLRGWDGPVLNEARRQVRAANGTQIEWHIGLEEPAARVRTLLADYTDFKEEQLRVIYTPVSQMVAR